MGAELGPENEQKLRERAKRGDDPCANVSDVKSLVDPPAAITQGG